MGKCILWWTKNAPKKSISTLFLVLSSSLKWVFRLQIKFLQELCVVHFFEYITKHIQWKHLNQTQKIHIEKY
jgi:hypothetical protein